MLSKIIPGFTGTKKIMKMENFLLSAAAIRLPTKSG